METCVRPWMAAAKAAAGGGGAGAAGAGAFGLGAGAGVRPPRARPDAVDMEDIKVAGLDCHTPPSLCAMVLYVPVRC